MEEETSRDLKAAFCCSGLHDRIDPSATCVQGLKDSEHFGTKKKKEKKHDLKAAQSAISMCY